MRTPGSAAELEARRRGDAEYFQERRPLQEIATLFRVTLTSVKCWNRTWKAKGVEGLAAKAHPGPACKLSEERRKSLVKILLKGPITAGHRDDLWICARVSEVVRKQFRVSYHRDHMRWILHDLGFSPQKPKRMAREQDAEAVKRWRRRDWPRIICWDRWTVHRSAAKRIAQSRLQNINFEWLPAYAPNLNPSSLVGAIPSTVTLRTSCHTMCRT